MIHDTLLIMIMVTMMKLIALMKIDAVLVQTLTKSKVYLTQIFTRQRSADHSSEKNFFNVNREQDSMPKSIYI